MGLGTQHSEISSVTFFFNGRNLIKTVVQFYTCEVITDYINTTVNMALYW